MCDKATRGHDPGERQRQFSARWWRVCMRYGEQGVILDKSEGPYSLLIDQLINTELIKILMLGEMKDQKCIRTESKRKEKS